VQVDWIDGARERLVRSVAEHPLEYWLERKAGSDDDREPDERETETRSRRKRCQASRLVPSGAPECGAAPSNPAVRSAVA